MNWRHSGFSVNNKARIAKDDKKRREALAQYIIRNTFSLDKLSYNRETSTVLYRSKMTSGKNKKNFQVYTAEEFIAAITQHIPEKSFQMVRYYGWYSNKSRGLREKQGNLTPEDQPLDETDEAVEIIDIYLNTNHAASPQSNGAIVSRKSMRSILCAAQTAAGK